MADLPFFLLFVFILWMIGGWLVLVVLLALPLLVIPGLLVQRPLARLANEGMRESAVRNATLVEAVQSIEDIKLLRAEQRFQNQWNHTNDVASSISMKQRFLTGLLLTWTRGSAIHRLRRGAVGGLLYGDERRHDHRRAGRDDDHGFAHHRAAVADIRRALALAAGKGGA